MSGVDRVAQAFDRAGREKRPAIIAYLVAGYPTLAASQELLARVAAAGADIIEVGIPFSDPVADGPTIQSGITNSLERGTRPSDVLAMVRRLRAQGVQVPILGMTYANIVYAPGWETSAARWRRAGLDGAIIPDIPLEESADYRSSFSKHGLATVMLATPTTPAQRLSRIANATTGFLYLVAVYGTTGARKGIAPETRQLLHRVADLGIEVPACVGFGVSRPDHVSSLYRSGADGVVVGSALVDCIRRGQSTARFIRSLRGAVKAIHPKA